MSKKEGILKNKIAYRGTFDFEKTYLKLIGWLEGQGFGTPYEKLYIERVKPGGKFIEIIWETSKTVDNYFKFTLEVTFYAMALKEVEVDQPGGKKLKLDSGELQVSFNATLIMNASEQYKEKSAWHEIYKKYFIKHRIEEQKIELYKITTNLIEETKNHLNLYKLS